MKVTPNEMVALGYGKYFRSDAVIGLEPIEEGRGPGKRTHVYLQGHTTPMVASRSESAILRDLIEAPAEVIDTREQLELLKDIAEALESIQPMLRSIVRDQGSWDLDRLEERLKALLGEEE
ncbi:MAG: hypothetical protein O7E52_23760 [Candidatus Poribacteria bacterium]|nr:hypothetical protein [Candidatus Poribacteria bacterium]